MNENNTITLKRLQYTRRFMFMWAYIIEEITIDPKLKTLEMKSQILKKSDMIPMLGIEYITYKAVSNEEKRENTVYAKRIEMEGSLTKIMSSLSDGFKNGIKIVEENCEVIKSMSTDDWVSRFSKSLSI